MSCLLPCLFPGVQATVRPEGSTHRDRKGQDGDLQSREGRGWALQPDNRKAATILFFPGALVAPGLTRPRGFLMLLVQHLGHVVLLLLLDPEVRHVIPATEPAGRGLGTAQGREQRSGSPLPSTTPSLAQTPHLKISFCWLITCCNSLISFSLPLSISSCFIM